MYYDDIDFYAINKGQSNNLLKYVTGIKIILIFRQIK